MSFWIYHAELIFIFNCLRIEISAVRKKNNEIDADDHDPDFMFENEPSSSDQREDEDAPEIPLVEKPESEKSNGCPFKCTNCSKAFFNEAKLEVHFRYHHQNIKCDKCNKTYVGRKLLHYHFRRVHPELKSSFPCSVCGEAFSSAYLLSRHKVKFHGNHQFKCPHCRASFKLKTFLDNHVASTHNSHSLPCIHCGKRFKAKTYLRKHIRAQHPDEFSKTFSLPGTKDAAERKFHCPKCSASFKDKHNRSAHLKKVHCPRNLPCPRCKSMFKDKSNLSRHIRIHCDDNHFKQHEELTDNAWSLRLNGINDRWLHLLQYIR